jgi:hypothetical protein
MPHAPILIPSVARERVGRIQSTVAAMRETARRAVVTGADAVVIISPLLNFSPDLEKVAEEDALDSVLLALGATGSKPKWY